jgi:hypothetical protein
VVVVDGLVLLAQQEMQVARIIVIGVVVIVEIIQVVSIIRRIEKAQMKFIAKVKEKNV